MQVLAQSQRLAVSSSRTAMEPGIYTIKNCAADYTLDLSGGDEKSIIAFSYHGFENQQVRH